MYKKGLLLRKNGEAWKNTGPIEVSIVGDGLVGKSSLLHRISCGQFEVSIPVQSIRTYQKKYKSDEGTLYKILLKDLAGAEDNESVRKKEYLTSDVILLCYSVDSLTSILNTTDFWMHEIRKTMRPNAKIILVETKGDLKDLPQRPQKTFINFKEIVKRAQRILDPYATVHCSSKNGEGIQLLLQTIVCAMEKSVVPIQKYSQQKRPSALAEVMSRNIQRLIRDKRASAPSLIIHIDVKPPATSTKIVVA